MVLEGYSMLPHEVRQYTDPALQATSRYTALGLSKAKEGCSQAADVIFEQYKIYSPPVWQHWEQFKLTASEATSKAMEHGRAMTEHVVVFVRGTWEQVFPQAKLYFDIVKDTTVHYGKLGMRKSADLILDGVDLAYDGYAKAEPYIQTATDRTKEVLGPYIGPYIGPYWDIFYNTALEHYRESMILARTWSREINIGQVNLEKVLFADEIEKENIERTKAAAEKIKAAVEAMNKKIEEDKAKEAEEAKQKAAEEEAKRKAEQEAKLKAEQDAKKKAAEEAKRQAELKKKAEEEAKRKAEEEAKIKAELEAKKKAEAEAKRQAELKKKAEEEAKRKAEDEARVKA